MDLTSKGQAAPGVARNFTAKVGAACAAVGFAIGLSMGLWVSRTAIADECESTGHVSTGDRVFACTDGRIVAPGWR